MHKQLRLPNVVKHLPALLLMGFVLRIIAAQLLLGGMDRGYEGDEGSYVSLATHITQSLGFTDNSGRPTSYRAPGLPLLVTIPVSLVGPNVIGIRIFMCLIES